MNLTDSSGVLRAVTPPPRRRPVVVIAAALVLAAELVLLPLFGLALRMTGRELAGSGDQAACCEAARK